MSRDKGLEDKSIRIDINKPGKRLKVTSSSSRPRRGWLSRSIPGESMAMVCSLLRLETNSTSGISSEHSFTGKQLLDVIERSTNASVSTKAEVLVLFWL